MGKYIPRRLPLKPVSFGPVTHDEIIIATAEFEANGGIVEKLPPTPDRARRYLKTKSAQAFESTVPAGLLL